MIRPEHKWTLAGLFILALVVRLIRLGHADLWCDEILFVWLSSPPMSAWDVVVNQWRQLLVVTHLPFPEVIQNLWLLLMGPLADDINHDAFLQRLPAAIWGALTVPVIYRLGRLLLSCEEAMAASLMVCFFVFPVYYSREAYYYAPVIFCSSSILLLVIPALEGVVLSRRRLLWLLLASIGLVYSHITGIIFVGLLFVGVTFLLVKNRVCSTNSIGLGRVLGVLLMAMLTVSPWLVRLATNSIQAGMSPHRFPVAMILYDAVGKFFLGSMFAFNVAAVVLLGAALVTLSMRGPNAASRRFMLWLLISCGLIISVSVYKTSYHVRYFSVLTPVIYLAFASALHGLALLLFQRYGSPVFRAVMFLLLAFQITICLPLYYRLEARSVDYGRIAKWIIAHVPPGGAFLMESGYDLRFVSGYFSTPDRIGAIPYVHGDLGILQERQKAFVESFPDAPWIESGRHGWKEGMEFGAWEWPHQYFRNRIDLRNEALAQISRWGIGLAPGRHVHINELWTPIWFNLPQDIVDIARNKGQSVVFEWPDWRCVSYRQDARSQVQEYARAVSKVSSKLAVRNIHDEAISGKLRFVCGVTGTEAIKDLIIRLNREIVGSFKVTVGQIHSVETEPLLLPKGQQEVEIMVVDKQDGDERGMVVIRAEWMPL